MSFITTMGARYPALIVFIPKSISISVTILVDITFSFTMTMGAGYPAPAGYPGFIVCVSVILPSVLVYLLVLL